jgi:hypothetical protein
MMVNLITTLVGLCALMGVMFWVGYRLGYNNGLAVWRKDYSRMSTADVEEHKRIVTKMDRIVS